MQFKPFEPGVEVNGQTVFSVVDGMGNFKSMATKLLLSAGIGKNEGSEYKIDLGGWYSQEKWLKVFEDISKEIGENTLKSIGVRIPANAQFPPWVKDIDSAIRAIDVAYHMNHRKNGAVLFDPGTGKMTEGIGHYGYERAPGRNTIVSECRNPYPCAFDLGIITAMATRFQGQAIVTHDPSKPCRKTGADSCTYVISW